MSSPSPSRAYEYADKLEIGHHLDRSKTQGGHDNDTSQPALPVVHRKFANPAPLGLLAFATSIFLISLYGVNARGITTPNVFVGLLIFFGGICQIIAGIMEFVAGNTFGATVFPSYGAFCLSNAMIYLPGTGIIAAYVDKETGELNNQFSQAIAMFVFAWFVLTMVFTVGAMRSSWVLFIALMFVDLHLLLIACGHLTGNNRLNVAGNSAGLVVAFLAYWAGAAGLYIGQTPFVLPVFEIARAN